MLAQIATAAEEAALSQGFKFGILVGIPIGIMLTWAIQWFQKLSREARAHREHRKLL